ncbi:MAG TPA: UDP-glucose 4-epimerase GalE, partial [Saprospiraceae bacterium]|nr:UDP-glucose 4-epimerase GalE [Saprospiraceae bacterium]
MNKIIVTGSCGYIGSHTVVDLIQQGYEVLSVDNHINSSPDVLNGIEKITNIKPKHYPIDLCDILSLEKIFLENPDVQGIIHFAALKSVNESVEKPQLYYYNNMVGLLNLLELTKKYKLNHFIFSSSCSVYGQANELPVTENTPLQDAECPYAYTKQAGERILKDICIANKLLQCIILRYFNPAGAHSSNWIGEDSINLASNLVPVITETAIGKRGSLTVFGNDYNTIDGSCVRDYIHVMDIARAHTMALQYIETNRNNTNCEVFNLGAGKGLT